MKQFAMSSGEILFSNYEDFLSELSVKKFIATILLFLGLVFLSIGLWKGYKNRINPSWSIIHGMVLNSTMESTIVPINNKNINNTYYKPKIIYEYEVNGKTHTNITNAGVVSKNDPTITEETVKKYSEGRLVKIFYNPAHPEEALVNTFSAMDKWVPIACGSLLFTFGVLTFFYIKIEDNVIVNSLHKGIKNRPVTSPKPVSKTIHERSSHKQVQGINGKWKLNYQIPSLGEIISLANQTGEEIRSAASYTIMLTIKDEKMVFSFNDRDIKGNCEILSRFRLHEDKLMLEHQSIDFLLVDIEDFPPQYYTYSLKGSNLILKTNKIKGLGDRQITYNFSKSKN